MTTNGSAPQSRLSTDLESLQAQLKGESLTLVELKQSLKDRGTAVLLILLALPFCFIAIPGLSTPFGFGRRSRGASDKPGHARDHFP